MDRENEEYVGTCIATIDAHNSRVWDTCITLYHWRTINTEIL